MADDILDELADVLDEETLNKLKARLAPDVEGAKAKRDLAILRNADLKASNPRAFAAMEKGLFDLGDVTDQAQVEAMIKAKEAEYTALGVPVPGQAAAQTQQPQMFNDPTGALGAMMGGQPAPPQRDLIREYAEAGAENTEAGRVRQATLLVEMNRAGMKQEILDLATDRGAPHRQPSVF